MRVKKYPSAGDAQQYRVRKKVEPQELKMKNCVVKIRQLNKTYSRECGKISDLEPRKSIKHENKVRISLPHNTSTSSDNHKILKPFSTVLRLGDMSFTSDGPFLKLSEEESVPKTPERITRAYRRKVPKDIYEFISQSEEDCDPTVDVVKKIIKEGKAKLVKWKSGKTIRQRKPRNKTISEYVKSIERYKLRNYKKILKERKSNCPGAWNQTFWDVTSLRNMSLADSKYDGKLGLDEVHHPACSETDLNDNVQNHSEDGGCSKEKNTEILQNSTSGNVKILEILVLPNKATIKPIESTPEDKISEEAIKSNADIEYYEEINDTVAEMPKDETPSFDYHDDLSKQNNYLLNEEPDYLNLTTFDDPSLAEVDSSSIEENSPVENSNPKLKRISFSGNDEVSYVRRDSCNANLENNEPTSSVPQKSSCSRDEKTTAEAKSGPKPERKAFWEIEDPEEEMLDKSLITRTYCRPKKKVRRRHFFIFFSDDEDTKKSSESIKENPSEYYTRSKIQNWIETTKSATEKDDKLDRKKTNTSKKPILKIRNKISDNDINLKAQQKQKNEEKNKVVNKIKAESNISSSVRIRGGGSRQLRSLRL